MAKSKTKARAARLFQNLEQLSSPAPARPAPGEEPAADGSENTEGLASLQGLGIQPVADASRLPRLKRFRHQLLHQWLVHNLPPCRAADIGGGKGLLSYLLIQSGWQATVIDPLPQTLPEKYKDIVTGQRVKIQPGQGVPQIAAEFETELAAGQDLLIGMHAHGCNAKIIDAAARYGCAFVIFPCCIIGEPFRPPPGVHWLESLAGYAVRQGLRIQPFRLNFKGQNIGIYGVGRLKG